MIFDEPLITSTLVLGLIVFACAFGGALLGLLLRAVLPEHHLRTESKDVVKLGMGLIATIDDPSVIRKILAHLGLPTEVPEPRPRPALGDGWLL